MPIRVKICGLTTPADVEWTVACGADAIGIVQAPSLRQVDRRTAETLLRAAGSGVMKVAVFREVDTPQLLELVSMGFDAVQAERLPEAVPPGLAVLPVITDGPYLMARVKALPRVVDGGLAQLGHAELLLDGPIGGGRGMRPDRHRARKLAASHRIVLAGGLNPRNVARAIEVIRPVAVDVSSGVERSPGCKQRDLVKAFIVQARRALLKEETT